MHRPPLPPFTFETAAQKVRMAEDAWNTRDPSRVALAYTVDGRWRNRAEFVQGREAIEAFLKRKWSRELDYRLIKELWAFARTASPFGSRTRGTTTVGPGFEGTAMRTGRSMKTGSCGCASRPSTTLRSRRGSGNISGRTDAGRRIILR
jgi:uncharacterized protein DUF1348